MIANPNQTVSTNGTITTMKVKKNRRSLTSSGKTFLTTPCAYREQASLTKCVRSIASECSANDCDSTKAAGSGGSPVRRISGKRNPFGHNSARSNSRSCRADGQTLWVCDVCFF
jgi:hypothetical protein